MPGTVPVPSNIPKEYRRKVCIGKSRVEEYFGPFENRRSADRIGFHRQRNMEVFFELISEADALRAVCEQLSKEPVLGFDTETTELDPYLGELRLVQFSTGKRSVIIDIRQFGKDPATNTTLEPLRNLIRSTKTIKVSHNSKFDAKWVRHHLGCEVGGIFDSYLASQLIAAGESDRRHSLADVVQFFIGTELDKTQQVSDWSASELSQSQLEYAARDAAILVPLYTQLAERLAADDLTRVAELEFDTVMPVTDMELTGFYLDAVRWRENIEAIRKERDRVADELQEMLAAGVSQTSLFGRSEINLDSQAQVHEALSNLGIPMPGSTRASMLEPLAEDHPPVAKLLEYRGRQKSLTSFGENFLEFIHPKTGRIHSDFRQIGAPTGRFSCSNPNLQQIPHENSYRRCFHAGENKTLIIADYSQIELRILAEFSGDTNFIGAFRSGVDFHAAAAAQVFNIKAEEVSPDQRSFAKRLNFGVVYGLGAARFAAMTGLSQAEAEGTLRKYFATYPDLDGYLRKSGDSALRTRVARTASGRLLKLRYDENDRAAAGAARRFATNMPIQGTSADILKRALRLIHDELRGTSGKLVNIVHDEIVLECDQNDAAPISDRLKNAMVSAGREFVKAVPIDVNLAISPDWTK